MKKYGVSIERNKCADVITTVLHISINGNLQSKEHLKPNHWETNLSTAVIQERMEAILNDSKALFRRCRFNYLALMFEIYFKQNDDVDKRIHHLLLTQKRMCVNQVRISFTEYIFQNLNKHLSFQLST